MTDQVDQIILRYLGPPEASALSDETPLASTGVDSIVLVRLMFDLEDGLDIEFPDSLVTAQTFETVGSLRRVVRALTEGR